MFTFFENPLSISADSGHTCSSVQSAGNLSILTLLKSQTFIDNFERLETRAVAAEYDFQATSAIDKTRRQIHQLLHNSPNTAAIGGVTYRSFLPRQPNWPMKRRILYARHVKTRIKALVANLPEGRRSISMSDLISLWNCSLVAWSL